MSILCLNGETPIETLTGSHPNLANTHEFGNDIYVLEELSKQNALPKT